MKVAYTNHCARLTHAYTHTFARCLWHCAAPHAPRARPHRNSYFVYQLSKKSENPKKTKSYVRKRRDRMIALAEPFSNGTTVVVVTRRVVSLCEFGALLLKPVVTRFTPTYTHSLTRTYNDPHVGRGPCPPFGLWENRTLRGRFTGVSPKSTMHHRWPPLVKDTRRSTGARRLTGAHAYVVGSWRRCNRLWQAILNSGNGSPMEVRSRATAILVCASAISHVSNIFHLGLRLQHQHKASAIARNVSAP